MKKFTIVSSILFVLLFVVMIGFVYRSHDFVAPKSDMASTSNDSKIWKMSMDEVVNKLKAKGLINTSTKQELGSGGLCSKAYKYSGAEIYWWDLNNLKKDSDEYKAYESLKETGSIDLYGSGSIISPKLNGPFAILLTQYEGKIDVLEKAFMELGKD
jgi:hypothetical protein